MRIVDLSHPVRVGMPMYPGLEGPAVRTVLSRDDSRAHYGPGTGFLITSLEVVGNTGTYLDAPFHRFPEGPDVSALPLERLAGVEALVLRAPGGVRALGPELLPDPLRDPGAVRGKAVLLHTGWDSRWGSGDYFSGGHPFLTAELAGRLAEGGAAVVGTDACNLDDLADLLRPAHSLLLGAGVPILENLRNLGGIPDAGARFFAVPAAVEGMASVPVRAFALVEG